MPLDIIEIIRLTDEYANACNSLIKLAKIRKLPNGKYRVLSMEGKNLGTYTSHEGAKKRLKQVEYFKHFDHKDSNDANEQSVIDLTKADEFSYSAIVRKLRQEATPEQVKTFLTIFKQQFDKAVKGKVHKPEKIALQNAMLKFNRIHKVKLDQKMVKNASIAELGNAEQVGKYLSDIVKFVINRVPPEKRARAFQSLRNKFLTMNEADISSKQLPASSALGQSITFVKHVLFNHDAPYVRAVLDQLVKYL